MKNKWYINIWKEGKYVDFWSLNHLLAGAIVANLFVYFGGSFWVGLIIVASLEAGWEMFEIASKRIHEKVENRVFDVVITTSGYFLNYYILLFELVNNKVEFICLFVLFLVLEVWGYFASRQKSKVNKI